MLRAVFALALALLLLWCCGGSTSCWQVARARHYRTMRQAPGSRRYQVRCVSYAAWGALQWPGKGEVRFGERFFDVSRVERTVNGYRLYGCFDEEDDRLASVLTALWEHHADGDSHIKAPPLFMLEATFPSAPLCFDAARGVAPLPEPSWPFVKETYSFLETGPRAHPPEA